MIVDELFHTDAVPPFPLADAADTVVRCATVAVVAEIIGKHVVPGVGQVLVLDHEVDLGIVEVAPRLAEVPRVPGATHGQGVVEITSLSLSPPLAGMYQASSGVPSSDGMTRSCHPFIPYSSGVLKMKLRGVLTIPARALIFA